MLSSQLFTSKTIEELMQDARMRIPLLTDEWTNYNPSDPAITTLENFSLLTLLQQKGIEEAPEKAKERLYQMAGFTRKGAKSARVLLKPGNVPEGGVTLPMGQKFLVGDMCFETNKENRLQGNEIIGLYAGKDGNLTDISFILDPDIPIKSSLFGNKPEKGMCFYIVCNNLGKSSEELIFHLQFEEPFIRNDFENEQPFSEVNWQCYTAAGFIDIKVKDHTEGFMRSGEIRIKLPRQKAAVYSELPKEGYVIRAELKKANFDVVPKIIGASGFLIEAWQKETASLCYTFEGKKSFEVFNDMLDFGYFMIFCKEDEEGSFYKYDIADVYAENGRYVEMTRLGNGHFKFTFDKEKYGYGPGAFLNAVKFVAYNEETMPVFHLGTVFGYENQRIGIPIENIVTDSFSVIARRYDENGDAIYDFIRPDSGKDTDFFYSVLEEKNEIRIDYAGDFVNAELYLCTCAKLRGEDGNVRAGSTFIPVGIDDNISFTNPAEGQGGRLRETNGELRRRFISDVSSHYTAVEAADYERLVKTTPGLCIHKVKAVMDSGKNQVRIAVKPYGSEVCPKLGRIYQDIISKRLESRRLLTTSVVIVQPEYIPVSVRGIIYVKSHYERVREMVENVIREKLDYVNTSRNFGEPLSFDEMFHSIEALECVDFVYELSVISQDPQQAVKQGMDIYPAPHVLLIPGDIDIELNTLE